MTCNGNNHSPDCSCGWGGVFHENQEFRTDWGLLDSYTIPNAKCPCCKNPVYFYRSSEGGSVYFDSMGWPWPKHACTSQGQPPLKSPEGKWWPFLMDRKWLLKLPSLPNKEGVVLLDKNERFLIVRASDPFKFLSPAPAWISNRHGEPGIYKLAILQMRGNTPHLRIYPACTPGTALRHPILSKQYQESRAVLLELHNAAVGMR